MSNFEIALTRLILKLELQPKSQNVGKWTDYSNIGHNFQYSFRLKSSPYLKMAAVLKILKYIALVNFDNGYEHIYQKKVFLMLTTSLMT